MPLQRTCRRHRLARARQAATLEKATLLGDADQRAHRVEETQEEEDDEVLGKAFDQRIVARTWVYVHPYRVQLLWATLLMMCIAVGNVSLDDWDILTSSLG